MPRPSPGPAWFASVPSSGPSFPPSTIRLEGSPGRDSSADHRGAQRSNAPTCRLKAAGTLRLTGPARKVDRAGQETEPARARS